MNHEEATVRAFIQPTKRERYLGFLSNKKGRTKFRLELAHFKSLNPMYIVPILPGHQNPSSIAKMLAAKGAGPKCWVISEDPQFDGQEMELDAALRETIGRGIGAIISCIPGKLAYFEDEDFRCILQRER
jgi:hypothetical protein